MRKYKRPYDLFYSSKSKFKKTDYRSRMFSGKWIKHLLAELQLDAQISNKTIFELLHRSIQKKEEHIPEKLYKFFSMNTNSISCLENQNVYLASPSMFNDPFDCGLYASEEEFVKKFMIEKIKEESLVEKGKISQTEFNKLLFAKCDYEYFNYKDSFTHIAHSLYSKHDSRLRAIYVDAYKLFRDKIAQLKTNDIRFCCFTAISIEQLEMHTEMWSHYADQHKGFCIEYDLSRIDFANYETMYPPSMVDVAFGGLFKCNYQAKTIILPKTLIFKSFSGNKLSLKEKIRLEKQKILSFLTKSTAWSYEHEWRLLVKDEYSKIFNHLISFPYVNAVYMGCRMSQADKETIIRIAQRNNFKIYESVMEDLKYSLSFREIVPDKYFKEKSEDDFFKLSRYFFDRNNR